MKPDEIKTSIDSIKPDPYFKTRLKAKINDSTAPKKSKMPLTAVISFSLCLALLVTAISFFPQKDRIISNTNTTETQTAEESKVRGSVIIAYANQNGADTNEAKLFDSKHLDASYPPMCKIGASDIRGKSEKEIENTVTKIKKEFRKIERDTDAGKIYFCMTTHCERFNNAIIYQATCGNFDFDLDEESCNDVKEIRIYNENTDYGYMEIMALDVNYDDNLEEKTDGIDYTKSIYITSWQLPNASLSGERYKKCMALKKKGIESFGISWKMNDDLYDALNSNPNMDLTKINDTLTFEVEFNNGETAKSIVEITFDNEGFMHCKGTSLETLTKE